MHLEWDDSRLDDASRAAAKACVEAGIACGAYLADEKRKTDFAGWGVSFFVVGSDQGALRSEINRISVGFSTP
jgi:2-keto-3-deoxy-L-rhamnonate aldolase RhmA